MQSDKPSDAQKFSAAVYRAIGDFANSKSHA